MPGILRITQQKRHPNRYNLFLDNDSRITVTDDMILQYSLHSGKELSDEEIEIICKKADEVFTREKALELLSMREHSLFELSRKLRQKGYRSEIITKVLKELEKQNYIDDERFAALYAEELIGNKRLGALLVREKLFKRGVPSAIISEILKDYQIEEQISNCRYQLEKKSALHSWENDVKAREKLIRYLRGKGFDWDIISQVIQKQA